VYYEQAIVLSLEQLPAGRPNRCKLLSFTVYHQTRSHGGAWSICTPSNLWFFPTSNKHHFNSDHFTICI